MGPTDSSKQNLIFNTLAVARNMTANMFIMCFEDYLESELVSRKMIAFA